MNGNSIFMGQLGEEERGETQYGRIWERKKKQIKLLALTLMVTGY